MGNNIGILSDETAEEFAHCILSQPSQSAKGELFKEEILSVDITDDATIVKAAVTIGELYFTDYITLMNFCYAYCHYSAVAWTHNCPKAASN